jgi:hypothetical protein
VAAVSGIARQRGLSLGPREIRSLFKATGTAQQNPAGGLIGPLPNLRAAIDALPGSTTPWTATASSSAAGLPPANAIDGNLSTRWSSGRAQASGQFFQLDLGSAQTFNRLVLNTGAANATEYPRGWAVRVSTDGTTFGDPIATGRGSGQLTTIDLPSTTARHIRVSLTAGSTTQWSIAEFGVSTVVNDFSMSVNPTSATVRRGASTTATVATTTTSGSAQTVNLSATGQPAGVAVSFAPASVTSGTNATMTVAVGADAAVGRYPITVTGRAGGTTRTSVFTLTVTTADPDAFALTLNPGAGTAAPGTSTTAAVNTTTTSGSTQTVRLSAGGQPTGVSVSFAPTSVTSGASSTMTVSVGAGVAAGRYPITVTGTGSVTRTATYTLTVTSGGCAGLPAWSATKSYVPGDMVTHRGHKWKSIWYSTGAVPGEPTSWAVWEDWGAC